MGVTVSKVTERMTNEDDTYNAYSTLPIVKSIKGKLRRQVVLLQVVPDELRNYNVVFVTKEDEEYVCYSFGDNTEGCLGLGHDKPVLEQPVPIKELRGKHVVQIVSGSRFVIARTLYDEVWSWGVNTSLQLAQPEESNHSVLVPTLVLLPFPKSSAIVKVACGHSFGALINRSGSVYTFGDNR